MSNTLQSIQDVVAFSQNLTQPPSTIASALRAFSKRDIGETILATLAVEDGTDPLSVMNVATHTLGALYLLSARLNVVTPVAPWDFIEEFCASFDPLAARHAPERVTILAKGIAYYAELNNSARAAISPLRNLLWRYAPNPSWLTTIHPVFLKVCVKTQSYTEALRLISTPITEIDKNLSNLSYTDNLAYHYLAGVTYIALRKFEEAEDLLDIVISAPGQTVSALQVEALKKHALVQLILYGKTKPLSKYTHSALSRHLKQSPYQSLIKHYPSTAALTFVLETEQGHFATDGNIGLVKEVITHAPRWVIRKLTNTYVTLSLEEIVRAFGTDAKAVASGPSMEEVKNLLQSMIERNEIYATLTPSANGELAAATLTFRDPPPPTSFDSAVLEAILQRAQEQGQLLAYLDKEVGKNKDYLTKALLREKADPMGPYDEMEGYSDPMMRRPDWDD